MQSGVLNSYLSVLQARHAASKPDGAPSVHLFSTFFFSKLLEGISLYSSTEQDDPDWGPRSVRRSGRKRKVKQAPVAVQPMQKRSLPTSSPCCSCCAKTRCACNRFHPHTHCKQPLACMLKLYRTMYLMMAYGMKRPKHAV